MYILNSTRIYLRFMYICGEFKTDPGDDKRKRLGKQRGCQGELSNFRIP